jgi:hypothetical protein
MMLHPCHLPAYRVGEALVTGNDATVGNRARTQASSMIVFPPFCYGSTLAQRLAVLGNICCGAAIFHGLLPE